jgi:hypothetical protein
MANDPFSIKDIVTIAALFFGPVVAVWITLWSQRRLAKQSAKRQLFLTLMANRKRWPPTIDWVNALNLIDVVFADDDDVVSAWHSLYDAVSTNPFPQERVNHSQIELLSTMAHSLGYKYLQQTDIDKYYSPVALGEQANLAQNILTEFLRVLKAVPTGQSQMPPSVPPS